MQDPEDPESTKDRTVGVGGKAIGIGRAVANHEARRQALQSGTPTTYGNRNTQSFPAPSPVRRRGEPWSRRLGDVVMITENPESHPEHGLCPTGAQATGCAGGQGRSLGSHSGPLGDDGGHVARTGAQGE